MSTYLLKTCRYAIFWYIVAENLYHVNCAIYQAVNLERSL